MITYTISFLTFIASVFALIAVILGNQIFIDICDVFIVVMLAIMGISVIREVVRHR